MSQTPNTAIAVIGKWNEFLPISMTIPLPDVARPKAGTVVSSVKRDGTVQ
jgi:hypothetical protein